MAGYYIIHLEIKAMKLYTLITYLSVLLGKQRKKLLENSHSIREGGLR